MIAEKTNRDRNIEGGSLATEKLSRTAKGAGNYWQ